VPISTGSDYYLSLQGFTPHQTAYRHTHPDSEEWVTVLGGKGEALLGTGVPLSLSPGMVIRRAERHPHGFVSGPEPMYLLSMQLPRPAEGATAWDEPGTTTDPVPCGKTGGALPPMPTLRRPQHTGSDQRVPL
jgi:quercetin dioxygenase-like cupin family protein